MTPTFFPSVLWTVRRTKQERVNFPSLFSPSHQQEIAPGGKKKHTHTQKRYNNTSSASWLANARNKNKVKTPET